MIIFCIIVDKKLATKSSTSSLAEAPHKVKLQYGFSWKISFVFQTVNDPLEV